MTVLGARSVPKTPVRLLYILLALVLADAIPVRASAEPIDELWLRYQLVADKARLYEYNEQFKVVHVTADAAVLSAPAQLAQVRTAAAELSTGLSGLLGRHVAVSCCNSTSALGGLGSVLVDVGSEHAAELGAEGFRIGRGDSGGMVMTAGSASGALYGAFRLLGYLQRGELVPQDYTSIPAMNLRIWDLWDELDGHITRGFAGNSILWPMALYEDGKRPPRRLLYLAACNASDPFQQWTGVTLEQPGTASPLRNAGAGLCMGTASGDPVTTASCTGPGAAAVLYNHTNLTLGVVSHPAAGACFDVNHGGGPDIDLYSCHDRSNGDYVNQQFRYNKGTRGLEYHGRCLALEAAYPGLEWADYKERFDGMLRLLKSAGINGLALEDVNACGLDVNSLRAPLLANVTRNLRPHLERWGVTAYFTVCFDAPREITGSSSDPLSPQVEDWWAAKAGQIAQGLPNSFGGFLVKSDSEGNAGPASYNRTEAQGANMLARAVAPHGGIVMWRAFEYGVKGTPSDGEDIARQPLDIFFPLDGQFEDNVILQVKNGPIDFQVREPVSPLLGGMQRTHVMMEVQATQEYTGQQIHAVGLSSMWKSYLDFDTLWGGPGATVANLLSGKKRSGMACVSNIGDFANWTGHILAASNTYGCGQLGWDPALEASDIHREWAAMTFPPAPGVVDSPAVETVSSLLDRSWGVYEGYTSPLGLGFIIKQENPYGCAPKNNGPGLGPGGAVCPVVICAEGCEESDWAQEGAGADHYWVDPCVNSDFSNYSSHGLGCQRTSTGGGNGYASFYSPAVERMFNDPSTCPRELLLFFHNMGWRTPMRTPAGEEVTLFEYIRRGHEQAIAEVKQMQADWDRLAGYVDPHRFEGVQARFKQQVNDAQVFRDVIVGWYSNISGLPDGQPLHLWPAVDVPVETLKLLRGKVADE